MGEDMAYDYSAHVQDFCLAESLGLLSENATVIGDNMRLEGETRDFKYLMLAHPSFETRIHDSSDKFSASHNYEIADPADDKHYEEEYHHQGDILLPEKDQFTISIRKSQVWVPYREAGDKDFEPGYPKD